MTAHKLASFKQTHHEMTSLIVEVQPAAEEMKMFIEVESLEEIMGLDKSYLVTILCPMHPRFGQFGTES